MRSHQWTCCHHRSCPAIPPLSLNHPRDFPRSLPPRLPGRDLELDTDALERLLRAAAGSATASAAATVRAVRQPLGPAQQALVQRADTFFIASAFSGAIGPGTAQVSALHKLLQGRPNHGVCCLGTRNGAV